MRERSLVLLLTLSASLRGVIMLHCVLSLATRDTTGRVSLSVACTRSWSVQVVAIGKPEVRGQGTRYSWEARPSLISVND